MAELNPALISPMTGRIRVLPTQQVCLSSLTFTEDTGKQFLESSTPTDTAFLASSSASSIDGAQLQTQEDYNHIFVIGDFAARNILRLIAKEEEGVEKTNDEELEEYEASKPAIKLTLGIENGVLVDGENVTPNNTGEEDLQALLMWGPPIAMGMGINK
ncbi:hypothetical protein D1P53_002689 [Cryptococcus gattii VGV]|nr:hypothetical protein D1P53_002689 [Cryptococcus gattii VGV]